MLVSKKLYRFTIFVFVFVFLVIVAGGVVRTTQSGMGCPDWPTCFGKWIPPLNASELPPDYEKYLKKQDIDHTFNAFHTWIEAINRYVGALLGVFAIIQVILYFRNKKTIPYANKLAFLFLGLVIATGLFGAIVVRLNLAHLSITVHLIFALLIVLVQLKLLVYVRNSPTISIPKKAKQLLLLALLIIIVQFILGTIVRMHVDEVSKALDYKQRTVWLDGMPTLFLLHRSFSWLVLGSLVYLVYFFRQQKNLQKNSIGLLLIGIANMVVGIVLYYMDMPSVAQPIHLLLASMAITQAVYLLVKTKLQ
jgi:heme a synthase